MRTERKHASGGTLSRCRRPCATACLPAVGSEGNFGPSSPWRYADMPGAWALCQVGWHCGRPASRAVLCRAAPIHAALHNCCNTGACRPLFPPISDRAKITTEPSPCPQSTLGRRTPTKSMRGGWVSEPTSVRLAPAGGNRSGSLVGRRGAACGGQGLTPGAARLPALLKSRPEAG